MCQDHSVLDVTKLFLAKCDFCRLLITFANGLDPDQDRQNVGPDLVPNRLTLIVFLNYLDGWRAGVGGVDCE